MADSPITVHLRAERLAAIVNQYLDEWIKPANAIVEAAIAWRDAIADVRNPFLDDEERALVEAVDALRAAQHDQEVPTDA